MEGEMHSFKTGRGVENIIDEILCYALVLDQMGPKPDTAPTSLALKYIIDLRRIKSDPNSYIIPQESNETPFSILKWTIDLISTYQQSNYVKIFRLITGSQRYKIICRAIIMQSINRVRSCALKILNKSLMKNERISLGEVARILLMDDEKALELCKNIDLKIEYSVDGSKTVVFKTGPLNEYILPLSRDDIFVFGNLQNLIDGQDIDSVDCISYELLRTILV